MHPAYKDDKELCKWLKENSSGNYRLAAYAAERIETLTVHLSNVQHECDKLKDQLETEEILKELESAANFMRGMQFDERIPADARQALISKAGEVDSVVEKCT